MGPDMCLSTSHFLRREMHSAYDLHDGLHEMDIRPRASSPEGNVSDASMALVPLVLNPLKGPQEGFLVLPSFDPIGF